MKLTTAFGINKNNNLITVIPAKYRDLLEIKKGSKLLWKHDAESNKLIVEILRE